MAVVAMIAWLVLMPADAGIGGEDRIQRRVSCHEAPLRFVWREGLGLIWPFLIVSGVVEAILFSVGMTVSEIGECRERIGMRR